MQQTHLYTTNPITQQVTININANTQSSINQNIYNQNNHIQNIVNNTIQIINQTLAQTAKNQNQSKFQSIQQPYSFQNQWNLLYFIRILFYILVVLKIIDLIFTRRRKMDIKERVYRKYLFSHSEMIRQFNDQDKKVMQTTLNNTIKNAYIQKVSAKNIKKISTKKVNIFQTKNQYFEARKTNDQTDKLQSLQQFLSNGPLMQPVQPKLINLLSKMRKQQIDDQPSQEQFQIIETISSEKQNGQKQIQMVAQKTILSSITQSTQTGEFSQFTPSTLSVNSNTSQYKQKSI